MPQKGAANVVDLTAARARRQRQPRTVILRASNIRPDAEVHRHIGLNDAQHLADLHDVLRITFGLADAGDDAGAAPWHFSTTGDREERLDAADELHQHLTDDGDAIVYHWGLWDITISAVESYPRDSGTPRALCVGGSGAFGGVDFDLATINAELTGTTTIREVLAATHPAVRDIIDRSGIFDFVPLLQALDLARAVDLPPQVRASLAELPVEEDPAGRDAFWVVILALACMSDTELTDHILTTAMDGLGWQDDDGTPLTGPAVRDLCVDSLARLTAVGGYGPDELAPVDRLDIYRELLSVSGD